MSRFRGGKACIWPVAVGASIVLLGAGCGSDSKSPNGPRRPGGALGEALAYVPRGVAAVVIAPTSLDQGPLGALRRQSARSTFLRRAFRGLEKDFDADLAFQKDVRPQLGNPQVFATGPGENDDYEALRLKHPAALRRALQRAVDRGLLKRVKPYKGAFITRDPDNKSSATENDSPYIAIAGAVALGADTERNLKQEIDGGRTGSCLRWWTSSRPSIRSRFSKLRATAGPCCRCSGRRTPARQVACRGFRRLAT
jgi:hypothetical protein